MTISVCIASRGRPKLLRQCVETLTAGMVLPDTVISVALDEDDDTTEYGVKLGDVDPRRLIVSIAPREDSLGAKYNRAQQNVRADLYVLWPDDSIMPNAGWDVALLRAMNALPNRTGAILFGHIEGVFQPGLALTQSFIDEMGFFCPPYFPTWWLETWPIECATMSGCYIRADIEVALLHHLKGNSTGELEIAWWAKFFDDTRPIRIKTAESLIRKNFPQHDHARLLASIPDTATHWLTSNSGCRDPMRAKQFAAHYGLKDTPPFSERYLRLKEMASNVLEALPQ